MTLSPDSWPPDVYLCIPAYQAATPLAALLPEVLEIVPASHVCVVDDGSTDGTAGVCSGRGVRCLRHAKNLGKGAALVTGFAALLEAGAEAVITMDADGQHAAGDLEKFLEARAASPEAGIITGKRAIAPGHMPLLRIVSNTLTSRILSWMCGTDIPDSQCGYRLYTARFLRSATLTCPGFALESEALLKAAHLGFPLRFIVVRTLYLNGASHISHVLDTLRWIIAVIKIRLTLRHNGISEPPHRV